jgi:hypothetical protein
VTGFLLHRPMSYAELQAEAYRLFCKNLDRTTECFELVDEVKAGEERESALVFLNQFLVRQIGELQAEVELERSRYTLGGIPPVPNAPYWQNAEAPRVSSADDPAAPPLRRSETSSSAHQARVGEAVDHVHARHGDVLKRLGGGVE